MFMPIVYNVFMAKRVTGVGSKKKTRTPKTKKRLAAKLAMLMLKKSKKMKHTRKIRISA